MLGIRRRLGEQLEEPGSFAWGNCLRTDALDRHRLQERRSPERELRERYSDSGGYYTGRRNGQGLTLGWHPSSRWSAAVGGMRNAIRFDEGRFTVRTATLRIDHAPSTQLAGSLPLQWANVSHELGASGRLRWQWQPGRELLFYVDRLGYTGEQRDTLPDQTRALLKLVWTLER